MCRAWAQPLAICGALSGSRPAALFEMLYTPHILLVEDSSEQARLIAAGLEQAGVPHHMTRANSGERALELLEDRERFSRRNPDLILLDLHLPGQNGLEVLSRLKSSSIYRTIPVVMLSGSAQEQDVRKAYDLHANAFVRKSATLEETVEAMKTICRMWLSVAVRPVARES
jgi:chemotaxis family two-component system response regulator Rcp1